ncbi:single-stranded DNA-binding protein [Streptosporangium sp. NPDC048865]|uniref:single-stranded DNA-binding protein n=1 Tax=Streptosporangium sp. NPDC048865 TaxID=3155766 RepID=UPI0034140894
MNDIYVTLTGNVAAPPRQHTFPDGSRVTSLKIASTSRYFDRENQQWRNGETTYFGVRCFRGLADNVAQSVHLGQPVVVQGRLRIREFAHEGERRFMPEVEANSLGHDLRWGLGSFTKPQRGGPVAALGSAERIELDRETSDWAMSGGAPVAAGAAGAPSPLGSGLDEASAPRETDGTPTGEAAEDAATSGRIPRPGGITGLEDVAVPGEAAGPREAEVPLRGTDHEPAEDRESAGDREPGGDEEPVEEFTARRGRPGRSATARRQGGVGTRNPGIGVETAGSVPGAARIHPDASDEAPWPTRESMAA